MVAATKSLVDQFAENAATLRAFMMLSVTDPVIAERGMASNAVAEAAYVDALLAAGEHWGVPVTREHAAWCFDLVFSVAGRHTGFGP